MSGVYMYITKLNNLRCPGVFTETTKVTVRGPYPVVRVPVLFVRDTICLEISFGDFLCWFIHHRRETARPFHLLFHF